MAADFDPYRKWLGIPPEERPPNHYRLLGIGVFETDHDTICNAADRQMTHVRTYQSGRYSEISQEILNELSAARICLLDEQKKAEYDEQLRKEMAAKEAIHAPPPAKPPPRTSPEVVAPLAAQVPSAGGGYATASSRAWTQRHKTRRKQSNWHASLIFVSIVVAGLVAVVWALARPGGDATGDAGAHSTKVSENGKRSEDGSKPKRSQQRPEPASHRKPKRGPEKLPKPKGPEEIPGLPKADPSGEDPAGSKIADPVGEIAVLKGHQGPVHSAVFTRDGVFVLSGGQDRTVRLWDVQGKAEIRQMPGAANPVLCVTLSPDGQTAMACCGQVDPPGQGMIRFWELSSGLAAGLLDVGKLPLAREAEFSPNGKTILVAGDDGTMRLLGAGSRDEIRCFAVPAEAGKTGAAIRSAAFSPDGNLAVSGGDDGSVRIWDVATAKERRRLPGHTSAVNSVAFSADSTSVLSGGADGTVRAWEVGTGKLKLYLDGHRGAVTSVAYSPDGTRALSGGADGSVRLWRLDTAEQQHRFEGHQGGVQCVAFSANGRRAVSAGSDGTVRIWGLPVHLEPGQPAAADQPGGPKITRLGKPVPDTKAQQAAEQRIKDGDFKADFAAGDKTALARKLLERAGATPDDTSAYVLLRLAQELGIEAGQTDTALQAAEQLGRQFEVDAVNMKIATLTGLTNAPGNSASKKLLVEKILSLMDEAAAADDFTVAEQLADLARSAASKTRDPALTRLAAARTADMRQRKEAYQQVAGSVAALKKTPDDPAANEELGKYYSLVKGDWVRGLPRLAKAADARLKQVAQTDLSHPQKAPQQAALADGWWEIATQQSGTARGQFRRRAAHWYELALPGLTGEAKEMAELRLRQAGDPGAPAVSTAAVPDVKGLECREPSPRAALLMAYGGNAAGEAAVERALEWLAEHQKADGSWSFDHHGPKCKDGQCPDPGTLNAPNAATALALLPLLGANHNPRHGRYRKNVLSGIQFLRKRMMQGRGVGILYEAQAGEMPSHALGTIALCEAFAATRDKSSRAVAQAAVNFIVLTQNDDGGWGNKPKIRDEDKPSPSNMPAFGWNLAALQTARWAGLDVPDKSFQKAAQFLDKMSISGKGAFRRAPGADNSDPAVTAIGFLSRMVLGWQPNRPELAAYVATLQTGGPSSKGDFLFDFFASSVMRESGGPPWQKWNAALLDTLIARQATQGHQSGSWFQSGGQDNSAGGRLFCTALAALTLEVYYRNPPLYP